jgi:hypothetical protein
MPFDKWDNWYAWKGFYSELQKQIGGNWEYVSNPSGGFLGYWWNWKYAKVDGKEFEFYLQIEQDRLVFKLTTSNENERQEIRKIYRDYLFKKAKEHNIKITQFGRIGAYMGVAKLVDDFRIKDKNEKLDFTLTVGYLKKIMKLINEIEKEIKSP